MRFIHDDEEIATHLRIYMNINGSDLCCDVDLSDHVPIIKDEKRYFDTKILNIKQE